jgi:hypothetical protein
VKQLNTFKDYLLSVLGLMTLNVARAGMLWIAATVLPAVMFSDTAFAQGSTVILNSTEGPAGTRLTGTGANWQPGDRIQPLVGAHTKRLPSSRRALVGRTQASWFR